MPEKPETLVMRLTAFVASCEIVFIVPAPILGERRDMIDKIDMIDEWRQTQIPA